MLNFKSLLTFVMLLSFMSCSALINAKTTKDNLSYEELNYSPSFSVFTLWAPTATEVRLNLYANGFQGFATQVLKLKQNGSFWSVKASGNLKGNFYTFQIKHQGLWLNETPGIQLSL